MTKGKELAKNTIIIVIGKICTQFISFFLIPLYTSYLQTTDYGTVDLINTYISLLIPIVTLQLEQATFRFLIDVRNDEEKKGIIITSIIKKLFVHFAVYLGLYLIVGNFIKLDYKYFLLTNIFVCMFSSILLQIARGLGKTKIYTYGSMVTGITQVVLNVILIAALKMNASGILISNLIANIICCLFLIWKLKIGKYFRLEQKVDKPTMKEMYKYSLPMIPNSISWWVVNVSDRTIISAVLGLAYNGIYSISNKFSNIYILIYNLFNLSWTETVSLHINDKDATGFLKKMINRLFNVFASICILIIAVLPLVFDIFVKGEYKSSYNYMPILLIASLFNVVVGLYSAIYVAKKETKELAKSSVTAAIINIVVNIALIKFIGLYATAISTLVSYFVMMIARYIDVKKYVDAKLKFKNILVITIGVLLSLCSYYINNIYLTLINLVLMIILASILNRAFLIDIVKGIKEVIGDFSKRGGNIKNES